jgi:PncC family amidohydrolase
MDCEKGSVEGEIGELLRAHKLSLSVAESATGGMIAARIVEIAGASDYFKGGVVSYDNSVKQHVLGVAGTTLQQWGAVSEQTALEMAEGVRKLMDTDISIADTGIAGPAGGTPTKPLGLFYIGLATKTDTRVQEFFFSGTRAQIRKQATEHALVLLRDYLRSLK